MTLARRFFSLPLSLSLVWAGCTSIEGRDPAPTTTPRTGDAPRPSDPSDPKTPEPATDAAVKVAIASVVLDEDCRPATPPAAMQPAKRAPPRDVAASAPASSPRPADQPPGAVAYVPPCNQSIMQVSFDNPGTDSVAVGVASVRIIDAAADRSVGSVNAGEPTAWSGSSVYKEWDQRVAPGAQTHASWFLSAPDWNAIGTALGSGVDARTHALELEVTFSIAGKATTVRSPQFTRPPEIVMPPT